MIRTLVAALAVAALVTLSACASAELQPAGSRGDTSSSSTSSSGPSSRAPSSRGPTTAASNKAEAEAELNKIIGLISLPPGSVQQPDPSPTGGGPALGTPDASDLVNLRTIWTVPLPYTAVMAWGHDHQPAGFTPSGTSGGTGLDRDQDVGVQFTAPADPAAPQNGQATLSVAADAVAGDRSTSTWTIDAADIWYDPTPVRVPAGGIRLHVTVAQGCPDSLGQAKDVSNAAPGLDTAMLPEAAPTQALVCVFTGLNAALPLGHSLSRQLLDATQALSLATQARALRLGTSGEVYNCPADQGQVIVIAFAYPQGDVDLWWHTDGCPSIDNGTISAFFGSLTLPKP